MDLRFISLVVINFTVVLYLAYELGIIKATLENIETDLIVMMSYLAKKERLGGNENVEKV